MSEKIFNEWLARLEEGVKNYHIHKNNDWLEHVQLARKQLKKMFQEQQKEIIELDESLNVARIGRRDLAAYVKKLKEENELLSEHCAKLEKPIIDKVLKKSKKGEPLEPDFDEVIIKLEGESMLGKWVKLDQFVEGSNKMFGLEESGKIAVKTNEDNDSIVFTIKEIEALTDIFKKLL